MIIFPTFVEGKDNPVLYRTHMQTLQRALRRAGLDPGPIGDHDNILVAGSKTAKAVRAFQAANGIPANGVVGPDTWEALPDENMQGLPNLSEGSVGGAVAMLQRILRDSGFDPGSVDGTFDADTTTAVKGFQNLMEIVVDGFVGGQTWTTLNP